MPIPGPRAKEDKQYMSFYLELAETVRRNNSLLCIGLDPHPHLMEPGRDIFDFNRQIIDATCDLVCAYKPNWAFYEAAGAEGLEALRRTISYIRKQAGVPVILDAKRGDISSSAGAYARAAFETWGADALTVNPYLGGDAVAPFTEYADKGVFLLCHTSNPGAADFQSLPCPSRPLYELVAERAAEWNCGLVAGATHTEALAGIRAAAPQAWILMPGVGTQGGDLEASMAAGRREDGLGLIINSSRSIIYADEPRSAALELLRHIRECMSKPPLAAPDPEERLILELADIGAVKFGDFTLTSGQKSPVYIDLRLLASYPAVLRRVSLAYAAIIAGLPGVKAGPASWGAGAVEQARLSEIRLAALPYAALPIGTALSLETGLPLIFPRKEIKRYGTGRAIEGFYHPGDRALVLDDLITTGGSKLEAIASLEAAGLVVEDVIVLIDREQGGRRELEEAGYRFHAALKLSEMAALLAREGRISPAEERRLTAFLKPGD